MQIDVYSHMITKKYMSKLYEYSRMTFPFLESVPTLFDLEERFRIMDRFDDLVQLLVPGGPSLEMVVDAKLAPEMARIYNDELAELVQRYPDRFPAAVADIPVGDIEVSIQEIDRAINDLKFRGIFLQTPIFSHSGEKTRPTTKPLDSPELFPIYERMVKYNLPILLHPRRLQSWPDYSSEAESKYLIWQCFGWPYESTAAMARLVFGGVFERFPDLRILTHHAGAMIPFFDERIASSYAFFEMRLGRPLKGLTREALHYFQRFYADTALCGSTAGLMCAHAFFGTDRMLFGTDFPWDSQLGYRSTRKTIDSVNEMDIPAADKAAIFENNARELFRLPM